MSTDQDQAREIAERIARRVSGGGASVGAAGRQQSSEVSSQLAAVRAGINDLQRKLAQLEAAVSSDPPARSAQPAAPQTPTTASHRSGQITHSPWLAGINSSYSHPSEERFGVEEATVSALVDFFEKEKLCSVEPGGKPCDHCAMCSSRGF
ncbi:MAG TPA: hypothetical protein VJS64_07935 [Pyrinomonadaceae bacterium]|nr:hypothetical protein [Pyrinomonadaceae bacterium]